MTTDEFAKTANALLAEGIELLRAHAGEGDVINRYCATVEKVRAQYRAAKEAPAPPLVGTCKHGCRTNECETSCDDKCVVQHQESAPALLLAETCCVPWQSCEKHPRSPAPAPDVYTGPVLAGMRFKCKDSVFVPDGRRGKQGEFLNAQGDGLSEPNLRGMYRPIPDPASDVAPPGFRIVGRSGPGVAQPAGDTWVRFGRWSDGTAAGGEGDPFDPPMQAENVTDAQWNAGCYDILEPIPAETAAPPPAATEATREFRVVGCSGPDVPMPAPDTWVCHARFADGRIDRTARVRRWGRQRWLGERWKAGEYDVLEPIPAPAPEPSAPPAGAPVCKAWCGKTSDSYIPAERPCAGDPSCVGGPTHGGCYCSGECVNAGRPISPPPAPTTCEPWCGLRYHRDEVPTEHDGMNVLDCLSSADAPGEGVHSFCSQACRAARRPLNPPPSDPVTVATGGVPVHGCKERRAMSGLTFNAFAALNRKRCEVDFHRTLDDTNDHTVETWALKLLEEAGEVAQAVLRFGGKSARKSRTTEQDIGDEISDVVSYCALLANRLGLDFEQTVIRKWNAVSERVGSVLRIEAAIQETGGVPTGFRLGDGWTIRKNGDFWCSHDGRTCGGVGPFKHYETNRGACAAHAVLMGALVPVDTARPGPAHPATGTTCTRCGQVIQSVPFAFPPVATVDGWRHERCPEVPPEPVRDSIDALRYAVQVVPPGPVPVEASVGRSGHDRDRGLYGKFVIERTDGKSRPGEKHFECRYFVLDLDHDEHAAPALRAYATSCERAFPALAVDLRSEAGGIVARSVPSRTVPLQPAAPASEPAPTCSVPCLSRTCPRTCELGLGHPPDRDHSHASRPNEAGHAWPASEPAVRPLLSDVLHEACAVPTEWAERAAALEAELAATARDYQVARDAHDRRHDDYNAARAEVKLLQAKLAEVGGELQFEVLNASLERNQATARVRSMREAAAKVLRDAIANLSGPDYLPARIFTALGAIERIPLDTGTATDTSGEAGKADPRGPSGAILRLRQEGANAAAVNELERCIDYMDGVQAELTARLYAQADAIKAAVEKALRKAARDVYRFCLRGEHAGQVSTPHGRALSATVIAGVVLRSGEDAPGAVTPAKGGE